METTSELIHILLCEFIMLTRKETEQHHDKSFWCNQLNV